MKLEWILLAMFLVSVVNNVAKAMRNPMLKNVLRLISIIVAIVFTYILHVLFGTEFLFELLKTKIDIASMIPAEYAHLVTNAIDIVVPFISTALTPMLLFLVFWILYFIFNLIHVNFVYKFLVKRQRRKDKKIYKAYIKHEKENIKREIIEEHEKNLALMDDSEDLEITSYPDEELDEDEIEDMVDERISHYKKYKKRKYNFFKDSFPKKVISIATGAISAFLIFGVTWISLFYTMDVLSRVTDSIHDTGAYDSKVYNAVEFVDKHVVKPYEESFVYKLYDSTAAIDFMTSTIRDGGKFEFEGETLYADDMVRDYFVRAVRLACELTSKESDQSHVVGDIGAIIKEPVMVSFLADVVVTLVDANDQWVEDILNTEPGSENEILNKFLAKIINAYRDDEGNWSADAVKNDFNAILDVVLISAENKLLANIISNSVDWDSILADREMITDVIGTISGVTFFGPVMETAFTVGMDAVGGILAPANNAAAYDAFVNKLIDTINSVEPMSDEDKAELQKLWTSVAAYTKNEGKINYVARRIESINAKINKIPEDEARIAEIDELINQGLATEKEIAERENLLNELNLLKSNLPYYEEDLLELIQVKETLEQERDAYTGGSSVWDYLLDPIYVIELIKDNGLALKKDAEDLFDEGEKLKADGESLKARAEGLKKDAEDLKARGEILTNKATRFEALMTKYANGTISNSETLELNNLIAEQEALAAEGKSFATEGELLYEEGLALEKQGVALAEDGKALADRGAVLLNRGQKLIDDANELAQGAQDSINAFQGRFDGFQPFINYFMTWMSVQKPFMIANEDKSTAPMAIEIDGVFYVCTTDILNLHALIDVVGSLDSFDSSLGGDLFAPSEGGDIQDKIDELEGVSVDDIINKISPELQDLFKKLSISSDLNSLGEGRVSELSGIIDFLIKQAYASNETRDKAWLMASLESYIDGEADTRSEQMAKKIIDAKDDSSSFDYKGVTSEHIIAELNFGEEWTAEARQRDVELLTEIIFDFVDYAKQLGEGIMPTSSIDTSQYDGILNILVTLGGTMDKMAETTCFHGVPQIMLESILKNEYVSMVMTPSMLYGEDGYMSRIEAGNLSYAEFMQEIVDTVKELIDAIGNLGGNMGGIVA